LLKGIAQPCWVPELEQVIATGPAHVMDIQQDHRIQLQWLRRVAPDYVLSYPSNLVTLARLVQAGEPLPGLKAILSISETLTTDDRALIESAFGAPVKNAYSCAEAGYLASPCPAGHGLHVHAENVLLEILDDAGQPCPPGQPGHVYITTLQNYRNPFLRYELGDEAVLSAVPCPCGRGLPLLLEVQGKRCPMFRLADDRVKSSITVERLVRKVGGHWQHQVVQRGLEDVIVRLAVDASWSAERERDLIERLRTFFEAPIHVTLEIHNCLPMPAHGKFQSMVCEV
jgi:phenylacetate-CoA ligase